MPQTSFGNIIGYCSMYYVYIWMCREEAPVEISSIEPFEAKAAAFEQVRVLIESIYKKFSIIKFANISKNSYTLMRRENFLYSALGRFLMPIFIPNFITKINAILRRK